MPLGASITWGQGSSTGNGYRQYLHDKLTGAGYQIDYVGSQQHGDMPDPDNEGWPGLRVEQVHSKARETVPNYLPDVYLINAGTNDCGQNFDVANAGVRVNDMLNYLWSVTPDATVILSTLLINLEAPTEQRVGVFNEQVRGLVWDLANNQGKRIVLAEMHGPDGPTEEVMDDQTHPTDQGFGRMADIWHRSFEQAVAAGYI